MACAESLSVGKETRDDAEPKPSSGRLTHYLRVVVY